MNLQKHKLLGGLTAMIFGGAMLAPGIAVAQEIAATAGVEVQTRGPIHEAFAGTVSFNPEVGIIVDQAPPALIEEVPPEQRLEGDNVAWIPGYWGWDEDQSDFLWISGIWRNLPPGREWVPGYWAETEGRHQWTSGYWEDSETTEVSYLPKPPRSVEVGPNIEASSNDQTWVPGNWVYRDDRYAWRTGYWVAARENWSWTPAYYRWTHRGYVYVDGYWDYPVVRRGVVFAPVRFDVGYYSRPDFYYTPATVISLSVFTNHLFLRPNYGHYYYGDYYEPRYRDRGYFASYSYNSSRYGYDPIYTHYRYENRNDRNWDRQRQDYYEYRRDHADARPPRSWAALSARPQGDRNRADYEVAERFDRVVSTRDAGGQRFQKVDQKDRERYVSQRQEIRKYGKEREQLETRKDRLDATGGKERVSVTREKIGRSPVAAKKSDRSDKDGGPPARLQPRASEKTQKTEKSDQTGSNPRSTGEDPSKGKRPKDGAMDRESDSGSKGKIKTETSPETRVKPGEKREKEPEAQGKEKRQVDPKSERRATPDERRPEPSSEPKSKPAEKRQADPTPERKANPKPERQADPAPKRQANPTPKRQADPTPERQANPKPERQADPAPKRQANPAPKRQADPTPERKANPTPKRQAEPQAPRKVDKPQSRQANPQPTEQKSVKRPQPQRQAEPRPQSQKPQSQPQAVPKQNKVQPGAPTTESTDPDKKKKKQAE